MYEKRHWSNPSGQSFHYLQALPEGGGRRPLLVHLHGAGERGNEDGGELDRIALHGYFERIAKGESLPVMMVAPQCPDGRYWGGMIESLNKFLDFLLDDLNADPARVYLTGLSMGGTGAWLWALDRPERFAAVAPVCGTGVCWYGFQLAHTPVWAFHGDLDDTVPPTESLNMVSAINRRGGNARLTLLHGVGHAAWNAAYGNNELLDWLLAQSLPRQAM